MTVEQTSKGPTPGAQAVRRAIAVLRIVASGQERGVRLLDVARATGINRATVHRLLQVLIEAMPAEKKAEAPDGLMNGPVINAVGRDDVVSNQEQVDDLLESLGF